MLQPRTPASHLAHFKSNASFEETLFRLEHALARSPWQVIARVDSPAGGDPLERPARLFVLAPPELEPAPTPELTWSLTLHNEVLVLSDADDQVVVGYPTYPEASALEESQATTDASAAQAWAAALARALREAAAAAAGAPFSMIRPPVKTQPATETSEVTSERLQAAE